MRPRDCQNCNLQRFSKIFSHYCRSYYVVEMPKILLDRQVQFANYHASCTALKMTTESLQPEYNVLTRQAVFHIHNLNLLTEYRWRFSNTSAGHVYWTYPDSVIHVAWSFYLCYDWQCTDEVPPKRSISYIKASNQTWAGDDHSFQIVHGHIPTTETHQNVQPKQSPCKLTK